MTSGESTIGPDGNEGHTDELHRLLATAVAAPPAERVERYRDRLAEGGPPVVNLLLQLERDRPHLGLFAVAVLEAAAKRSVAAAERAIRLLITSAATSETRAYAEDAINRLGPHQKARPRAAPPSRSFTILGVINKARRRRGEPILDASEAGKVLGNLARREDDPLRYRNVCWSCAAVVDEATNEHCAHCSWLVCWCGGCRAPYYPDPRTGQKGPCRQEVWLLADRMGDEAIEADIDFRGSPILTSQRPAQDAPGIAAEFRSGGISAVYHWTPLRGVASILRRGILSRHTLMDRAVPFVGHGYGSQDKEKLLSGYVCLSFAPKPWMMLEWSDTPVLLELAPDVLLGDGTLFIPGNSASASFSASSLASQTGLPAAEGLFLSGGVAPQAEAWVLASVPRIGIRAIHLPDTALAGAVSRDLDGALARPIHVTPAYFEAQRAT